MGEQGGGGGRDEEVKHGGFQGGENLRMIPYGRVQVIAHLSRPVEGTPPRVSRNVHDGLWAMMVMKCLCGFIRNNPRTIG